MENKDVMKYIHVCALLLMLACHISCAQKQAQSHQDNINYAIKDTVTTYGPHTMVRNVKQDRNGNIVMSASRGGVFRYDGKSFTNIASKIGPRRYWDVMEDRRGNLWLATTDSGAYKYNGKTFSHFTTKEGLVDNLVFDVYEDKAGTIWFGTGGGVSRYDGKSFQNFTTVTGLPHQGARVITEDKAGRVWMGTQSGLCFYDPRVSDTQGKKITVLKKKDGTPFNNIWSIIEDKAGNIWFGDFDGLWRYDGSNFTNVSPMGAYGIMEDKKGNIWTTGSVNPNGVGAWKLMRYDQKSLYSNNPTATEIMSSEKFLCAILEATDGSIWFGSLIGVYRYDRKTITDFKNKNGQ